MTKEFNTEDIRPGELARMIAQHMYSQAKKSKLSAPVYPLGVRQAFNEMKGFHGDLDDATLDKIKKIFRANKIFAIMEGGKTFKGWRLVGPDFTNWKEDVVEPESIKGGAVKLLEKELPVITRCRFCETTFDSNIDFKKHLNGKQNCQGLSLCRLCSRTFKTYGAMHSHVRQIHEEVIKNKILHYLKERGEMGTDDLEYFVEAGISLDSVLQKMWDEDIIFGIKKGMEYNWMISNGNAMELPEFDFGHNSADNFIADIEVVAATNTLQIDSSIMIHEYALNRLMERYPNELQQIMNNILVTVFNSNKERRKSN